MNYKTFVFLLFGKSLTKTVVTLNVRQSFCVSIYVYMFPYIVNYFAPNGLLVLFFYSL